jgi:hypothetical protein
MIFGPDDKPIPRPKSPGSLPKPPSVTNSASGFYAKRGDYTNVLDAGTGVGEGQDGTATHRQQTGEAGQRQLGPLSAAQSAAKKRPKVLRRVASA